MLCLTTKTWWLILKFAVYNWTARPAVIGTANVEIQLELQAFEALT